ncbi:ATP-binding protein [Octadecabacter ascidiaceicola]|uniref:Sensor histidine kinase LiaS n=1 Tax=Octadecabacter ascidiaceicola TaxID=1655543 RepID=A0A238K857_9RHOB|nr:ATP-binding protein [Octadecabacter ascidiaceicola]SMX38272.1 Sensor histidine kinase LiaS [Octadecabacter ascidiaceicola]
MNGRLVRVSFGMMAWVFGLAVLIYLLDTGRIRPIPGAQMITELSICHTQDCSTVAPQHLPLFTPMAPNAGTQARYLRFEVAQPNARPNAPAELRALYLPKISDNIDLWVNGQLVFAHSPPRRLWNTPLLIPLPEATLQGETLQFDITLYGTPSEGLELQPFYYAPLRVLAPYQSWRHFWGPGLARFTLGLMIVLMAALLVIWSFRRGEREYLWLGLACATATGFLAHYGYGYSFGGYKLWTAFWLTCVSIYVLLILKFLQGFLQLPLRWPQITHAVALTGLGVVILFSPSGYAFSLSIWGNLLITVPSGFVVLIMLWLNRSLLTPLDFCVFFGCLSTALGLGIYEVCLLYTSAPSRTMHLFQLMPLVMSLACIWLILSRLIHSLHGYETLTASLNDTIELKSAELEESFAELAEVKRREAIAEERDRIMLDLHDGIGGQLVSTLAYMESNNTGDGKIRRALEDALRDLALMLDSMENHDSLVTLLGMLRTRLEGLLSEHGIAFDWQVHGEPVLPNPGPSQSLHLARIVQEAITNVIKHAGADTITIYVNEQEIRISDNGKGFDPEQQATCEHPANGIANMKRRSTSIGAEFNLTSDTTGTHISLFLK